MEQRSGCRLYSSRQAIFYYLNEQEKPLHTPGLPIHGRLCVAGLEYRRGFGDSDGLHIQSINPSPMPFLWDNACIDDTDEWRHKGVAPD